MFGFLLWCILLVLCWPLALLAVVLYPLVWLVLLPFRIVGIAVGGVLELVKAIIFLPARVLEDESALKYARLVRSFCLGNYLQMPAAHGSVNGVTAVSDLECSP